MSTHATRLSDWSISVGASLLVLAAVALVFRSAVPPPVVGRTIESTGGIAAVELKHGGERAADSVFREETTLRDPTPLFVPTRWNAGENALTADLQREPGSSFRAYAPRFAFAEADLALDLPPVVNVPVRPVDAFGVDKAERPFVGFGQVDRTVPALSTRGAFVRILAAENGELLLSQALLDAKPSEESVWQPLEFLVAIDLSGVVRPPVLTESSRVAAVDGYFQQYLVQTLHIGERLGPGFYRVCIGP
jgi:hypothetical protein